MDVDPTTPASVATEPSSKAIRFIVFVSRSPDGISREDEVFSLHERMAAMANLSKRRVAAFRFEAVRPGIVHELSISPPVCIREPLRVLHHQPDPPESVRNLHRIRRFRARLLRPLDLCHHSPIRNRLSVPWKAFFVGVDHHGVPRDYLQSVIGL